MNYYQQIQYIANVDENDKILGKVEKWEAHKKGILHRAFTAAIFYKDQVILQHRKHVAFDGYFDLTLSSHPIYTGEQLQDDKEAVYDALQREWNITKKDLLYEPQNKGFVYYKAEDKKGGFIEHEIDYIFVSEINHIPTPNYEYAYGFSLMKPLELISSVPLQSSLAPWVKSIIEKKLI